MHLISFNIDPRYANSNALGFNDKKEIIWKLYEKDIKLNIYDYFLYHI